MTRRTRRAAVVVVVTAIDLAILWALARGADAPVALADAISVVVASVASWALHREVTYGGDLNIRWVRRPQAFAAAALVAGGVDDDVDAAGARVVRHDVNRGKGAAVRTGVLAATGRTVAFLDADLAYPPSQARVLLDAVEDGWDVAVGNRFDRASVVEGRSRLRYVVGRVFNAVTAAVLLGQYRDTQCGCKAFRADVARGLFSRARLDGFAFDVEILHLVEREGLSLLEVPVTLHETGGSTVRVARSSAEMLRDILRVRRWSHQGLYD